MSAIQHMKSQTAAFALVLFVAMATSPVAEGRRIDFAQYKTCVQCTGAGYGWCPIKRLCGGFANSQCGTGERYFRADYDASASVEKEKDVEIPKNKEEEKEKLPVVPQEETAVKMTTIPTIVQPPTAVPGKVLGLGPKEVDFAIAKSKDYWAVYYFSMKLDQPGGLGHKDCLNVEQWNQIAKATRRMGLSVASVNIDDLQELSQWKTGGMSMFGRLPVRGSTPSIALYLDNRDEVPQLLLSSADVVGEGPLVRMETVTTFITQEVSKAVLARATGSEKKRRAEKVKVKTVVPPAMKKKEVPASAQNKNEKEMRSVDEDALDDSF